MIEKIMDLGFNEYESKVFVTLLNNGPSTANDVSLISNVPMPRVYEILNNFANKGWVLISSDVPKRYTLMPETLSILIDDKEKEFKSNLDFLKELNSLLFTPKISKRGGVFQLLTGRSIDKVWISMMKRAKKELKFMVGDASFVEADKELFKRLKKRKVRIDLISEEKRAKKKYLEEVEKYARSVYIGNYGDLRVVIKDNNEVLFFELPLGITEVFERLSKEKLLGKEEAFHSQGYYSTDPLLIFIFNDLFEKSKKKKVK